MPLTKIPLLGYAPDLDPATPGVFSYCNGIEPTQRGWKIQRAHTATYNTSGAAFTSGSYFMDGFVSELPDGTEVIHAAIFDAAADKMKLYAAISTTLTEKSRGSFYTKPTGTNYANFSFCQFGVYTLATNLIDVLQIRDASTSNAFADSSATSIPKAKLCVTWGPPTSPRVMLFHYHDGTEYPDGWWTSHQGGPTASWAVDVATGAVNGRLIGAGPIRCAIAFGDDVVAFGDRQMWHGRFVGPPFIVKWTKIANDIGCCGPYAARVVNGVLYWVGMQGLFSFDGQGMRKMDIPIQRQIALQVYSATGFNARAIQVTGDATTRRLMVGIKIGHISSTPSMPVWYSINLDSMKAGLLDDSRGAVTIYQLYDRNRAGYLTVGGEATITSESSQIVPYAAALAEAIGFGLHAMGSDKGDTKVQTLIPRFTTAPGSYRMTDYYGPTFSEISNTATAVDVTTTPWRADLVKSANWHQPRFYFQTASNNDPEWIDVLVDVVPSGNR